MRGNECFGAIRRKTAAIRAVLRFAQMRANGSGHFSRTLDSEYVESGSARTFDTRRGILDYERTLRVQAARGKQVGIRRGFMIADIAAAYQSVEASQESGAFERRFNLEPPLELTTASG